MKRKSKRMTKERKENKREKKESGTSQRHVMTTVGNHAKRRAERSKPREQPTRQQRWRRQAVRCAYGRPQRAQAR